MHKRDQEEIKKMKKGKTSKKRNNAMESYA
jgi:hypothetical protein